MSELIETCPMCGAAARPEHIQDWVAYEIVPMICSACDAVFWVGVVSEYQTMFRDDIDSRTSTQSPTSAASFCSNLGPVGNSNIDTPSDFPIGSSVEVILREHVLYGMVGLVVEKKHRHYRVAVNGRRVVLPDNGIKSYHG